MTATAATATPPSPPPQAVLAQMINGYWLTGAILVAARLGVADALAAGPLDVAALATKVGAHEDSLYRVLRALAGAGVFVEAAPRRFAHSALSQALRSDVPGSMHGLAAMTGLLHWRAWPDILHSVRTGETAFSKVFGAELFDHLPRDPEAGRAFDAAMAGYVAATGSAVVAGYDFSAFRTIVDLGGGSGALLGALLARYPDARGINFDLPQVAERARAYLGGAGLAPRCEVIGGDFFAGVPAGGDAYTLKMVLHDWDDARSKAILANVRKVIKPDGRLLVIEAVIDPASGVGAPGKLLDLNMLVMTGGRERTAAEYAALYAASGFELTRVVPVHPQVSVIEGRPV